ncbi:MAG: septal ring lytic transglycosylase RlpA family protein [Gammaproteobacteria bacterium]
MTSWSSLTRALILLSVVLLTACGTTSPPSTSSTQPNAGRYEMENDSPLLEPLDLSRVRPVIPKAEPRTLAGNKSPYTINGRTYRVLENEAGYSATGFASWYGRKFHGHLTSNGEIYDMFQLSAAHTTLPIPSYIRVTNLDNGKSIVARVNDRGPFHDGRIVDLSYAGAVMLGYADRGTARVRVEAILPGGDVIPVPQTQPNLSLTQTAPPAAPLVREVLPAVVEESVEEEVVSERQLIEENRGKEFLQVGAFASEDSARALVGRLSRLTDMPVFIHSEAGGNGNILHKVRIGPVLESASLQALIDSVQAQRLGTPFHVRVP